MRAVFCILILFITFSIFAAEVTPIQAYFATPSAQTFQNAWISCNETLTKDPTSNSTKIMMATIARYEASRLVNEISPSAKTLANGDKFSYANLFFSDEKYELAIPLYQSINDSLPAWSCPWRHKGTSLFMLKKYKDAEASLQKAVETNTEHYDAYIWLAKTQYQLKKYKLALQNLEVALTLNPNAEENNDEVLSESSIRALHQDLLKKNGRK